MKKGTTFRRRKSRKIKGRRRRWRRRRSEGLNRNAMNQITTS